MLGTLVNAAAIVICAVAGALCVKRIPPRFEEILKKAIGLATVYLGIKGALDNQRPLLLVMSLIGGAFIGELIDIDRLMNKFGIWAERVLVRSGSGRQSGNFSEAFVSASILFCSGAMAIVGSMQSGLSGNHETLYAKSILDGSIALVFGASLGLGTAFSAVSVLCYQGAITFMAMFVRDYLNAEMIREMSATGSLIIAAIGFNFLWANAAKTQSIKVANLIPAVFIPLVYLSVEQVLSR